MDTVLSAVVSDLTSRFISFLVEKYQAQVATNKISTNQIPRLQRVLLQAQIVVKEAEGRRVTNHGMLLQLKELREAMYRGYYTLDTSKPMTTRLKRSEVMTRRCKLQSDTDNLKAMLDGMKEFLLILMHCPPIIRQPYNAYLIMEQCMFGPHVEKEQIVSFLLHPCSSFDVLPVIGPRYVGKRTLVEHACREEIVQRNFSHILRFRSDDLNNRANDSILDNCMKLGPSDGRFLIVVELAHDTDEAAWRELYHSLRYAVGGSKAILISGMDRVSSLGTMQALRVSTLHEEEYWYFFRVLAFGSASPYDHHPNLASIAKEIATELDCKFIITRIVTRMLRENMNTQFWRHTLWYIRKSISMDVREDPRDMSSKRFCPNFYSFHDGSIIFCYKRYEVAGSMMQGIISGAKMAGDLLNGRVLKHGEKFKVITQSPIPPYYYYVTSCIVQKPKTVDLGNKCLKRKRV